MLFFTTWPTLRLALCLSLCTASSDDARDRIGARCSLSGLAHATFLAFAQRTLCPLAYAVCNDLTTDTHYAGRAFLYVLSQSSPWATPGIHAGRCTLGSPDDVSGHCSFHGAQRHGDIARTLRVWIYKPNGSFLYATAAAGTCNRLDTPASLPEPLCLVHGNFFSQYRGSGEPRQRAIGFNATVYAGNFPYICTLCIMGKE